MAWGDDDERYYTEYDMQYYRGSQVSNTEFKFDMPGFKFDACLGLVGKQFDRCVRRQKKTADRQKRRGGTDALPVENSTISIAAMIGAYRKKLGLMTLNWNGKLAAAAMDKARCFEETGTEPIVHTCRGEDSNHLRMRHGYNAIGTEIVQWSSRTPQEAFESWRTSPVHDAVMRGPTYRDIGCSGPTGSQYWGTWVCEIGVGEQS